MKRVVRTGDRREDYQRHVISQELEDLHFQIERLRGAVEDRRSTVCLD